MSINLLSPPQRLTGKQIAIQHQLSRGSLIALGLYCTLVIGLFSYWAFWQYRLSQLQQQLKQQEVALAQFRDTEGKLALIKLKLSQLVILLQDHPSLQPLLTQIDQLTANVSVTELSAKNDGKVILSGTAPTSSSIESLESQLETSSQFSRVELTELSRKTNGYSFGLNITKNAQN